MKIRDLSRLSGVSVESIRKYRERGLLRPACNPDNGYYEYSNADFLNLLYIRKLRGAHLSLDTIERGCRDGDAESLLSGYRETIDSLEEQIRRLRRREKMLRLSYRHYERDAAQLGQICLIDAFGDKYDCYFDRVGLSPTLSLWIRNIDLFTLVTGIEQRWFEADALPARVPVRIGIGTYGEVLREEGFPIPEEASVFPEGRYAAFTLELDELDAVPRERLEPIRRYLRENGLRPAGGSTAYLYRVDSSGPAPRFVFRMRVGVLS